MVSLNSFTIFPEYLISVSALYLLVVVVLIAYNSYGLMLQKVISECIAVVLLMTCYLIINDGLCELETLSFYDSIICDEFSFFTRIMVCFSSAIYFLIIANSLKEQRLTSFEYPLITLFAALGLLLLCSSNDFLTAYLAIELSSLSFYILAAFKKTSSYSVESGLKYFIIGAISSAFFLLGSSFIYGVTGTINLIDLGDLFSIELTYDKFLKNLNNYNINQAYIMEEVYPNNWADFIGPNNTLVYTGPYHIRQMFRLIVYLTSYYPDVLYIDNYRSTALAHWVEYSFFVRTFPIESHFDFSFVEVGLAFIMFSLFIKLALAPFHHWSLDVYEGSPTSTTFFFAVISKLSIFVILTRVCYLFCPSTTGWGFYAVLVGLLSVFVGAFGGLKQRKLKTLLAYSSMSHMGYAIISFGVSTRLGLHILFFYLIIYIIAGLCT